VALICFGLGWLVARSGRPKGGPMRVSGQSGQAEGRATLSPVKAKSTKQVRLLIDAGGIELLPDASLKLSPLRPPNMEPP